jgi:hypothetical protein
LQRLVAFMAFRVMRLLGMGSQVMACPGKPRRGFQ